MPRFASYDGTELFYRALGDGPPLVCLPGGPGRSAEYLGDLGGLDRARQLILLDPRGVGESADPADPATFGVERLVNDVEALRVHLGLERMDLLAHSAGAVLATLYTAAYPEHLSSLVLITPGLGTVDVNGTEDDLNAAFDRAAAQSWYPAARAALEQILEGNLTMAAFRESRPFYYGRWDAAAQAHAAVGIAERHMAARNGYFADLAIDPPSIRIALTKLAAPVLLLAGELDPMVTPAMVREAAPLFNDAAVVVQPGAAHFPWVDDPAAFAAAVDAFLS
jgi:pimeloyl-ACP methyl ester carboxylesterase